MFPYIGNNHPNCQLTFIFFRWADTTNQKCIAAFSTFHHLPSLQFCCLSLLGSVWIPSIPGFGIMHLPRHTISHNITQYHTITKSLF
jgi:hypothetical protein